MPKRLIIEDLIILGRACPERTKDGRVTVCTAGYSPTLGFIRIYPTRIDMPLKRWSIVRVPVERNPRDPRWESWKIQGSRSEWERLSEKVEVLGEYPKKERLRLIMSLVDPCVEAIREEGRSLGIVKPIIKHFYFSEKEDYDVLQQMTLLGYPLPKTRNGYPLHPRIVYRCSGCRIKDYHDQQILEWGFYEWLRKNPDKPEQVWENAKILDPDYVKFFLVGNLYKYPNRFIVISVLRLKKEPITGWLIQPKKDHSFSHF